MSPWLVRHLLLPLHEWLKRMPTGAALAEARRWDRLGADALRAARIHKLQRMLRHAAAHTPYYRDAFAERGVAAVELRELEDLSAFPLLDRTALRNRREDLVARDRRRAMALIQTGGSTGEPAAVHVDRRRAAVNTAARIRAREWWGVRPGEREAVLWASPIEVGAQDRLRAVRDLLLNTRLYSALEGSDRGLDSILEAMAGFGPVALYGYASSLHLLARRALAHGVGCRGLSGLRAVFATAEGLSPEQREVIAEAFGCGVAGEYGARDAGLITHECPAGGHHILAEGIHVEILRPDGTAAAPGERGEIVTTHLESFGFPLIRYRTGDVGVLAEGACPCGLLLPRLERVEGRATDFLLAPDGRLLHALGAIYILRVLPGVGAFQIEQPTVERLVVRIVREPGFPEDGEAAIRDGLKRLLRAEPEIRIDYVDAIAAAPSGKHRYVISAAAAAALRGEESA